MIGIDIKMKKLNNPNREENKRYGAVNEYTIIDNGYIKLSRDIGNVSIDISECLYLYIDTYSLTDLIRNRIYSFERVQHRNTIIDEILLPNE